MQALRELEVCPSGYFCPLGTKGRTNGRRAATPTAEFKCPGGIASNKPSNPSILNCFCNYTTAEAAKKCECESGYYCPPGSVSTQEASDACVFPPAPAHRQPRAATAVVSLKH